MLKQAFDKISKSFLSPVLGHTSERWNAFVRTFMIRSAATCPVLQSSLTLDGTLARIFKWNQVARKMDLPQQSIPWTRLRISCWMSSILVGFTGTILGHQTFKFWRPCPHPISALQKWAIARDSNRAVGGLFPTHWSLLGSPSALELWGKQLWSLHCRNIGGNHSYLEKMVVSCEFSLSPLQVMKYSHPPHIIHPLNGSKCVNSYIKIYVYIYIYTYVYVCMVSGGCLLSGGMGSIVQESVWLGVGLQHQTARAHLVQSGNSHVQWCDSGTDPWYPRKKTRRYTFFWHRYSKSMFCSIDLKLLFDQPDVPTKLYPNKRVLWAPINF